VGDLDILASCKKGTDLITHFVNYEEVDDVISKGKTKSTVILKSGLQVDLRVIAAVSWGAGLFYFTGSKAHNIAIRRLALKRGLKINEYGVFKNDKRIAGKSEEEMYAQVDLPYIVPELRENRGEIKAAAEGKLPALITLEDIRGDLHMHTKKSDGQHTIAQMAQAALEKGYEYIAITEHSQHVRIARGLDTKALEKHIEEIDTINNQIDGIEVLKGIEVDILEDGSLDLPDAVLKKLDIVICAVHYLFDLPEEKQTRRIIKALENPFVNILAHPTGRLIGERDPYQIDMKAIMKAAKENNAFLELNSYPYRLDLNDTYCKMAKEMGLKIAINSDAHSIDGLENLSFGIQQARRGWLEVDDVINTQDLDNLKRLLNK
jgi:DNA polymerase (family 10)